MYWSSVLAILARRQNADAKTDAKVAMATKNAIIDALGERALLLPVRLSEALAANDRLKMCFTLLQAAEHHVEHPDDPVPDFSIEQRVTGLDALGSKLAESRGDADGGLIVPGVAHMRERILADVAAMEAPLALVAAPEARELAARREALANALPTFDNDRVPRGAVAAITSPGRGNGRDADSLHRLVMDLHRAVNALQASLAEGNIDGARVWHIEAPDRALIQAFMSGVNETAPLKFAHPGLGTTATRVGSRLVIQNDIGTTDAHVLVLHVERLTATLTYTDVHARRLEFFKSLFKAFPVEWKDEGARRSERLDGGSDYYLTVAHLTAADREALGRYLAFLGSRIVFLIDWNRARKQLRQFLPKGAPVRLLKWAADHKIGHRGFLELGGERLLYEAISFAQPTPLQYGERLHELLGEDAAFDYLQFVFRQATSGLEQGRAARFIRDEIKAELARRFRTANAGLLALALAHAERVFDLASAVSDGLLGRDDPGSAAALAGSAERARKWEEECDALVIRIRSRARRTAKPEVYAQLLHEADEAADGLEEAAFLLTHLGALAIESPLVEPVQAMAALLVEGAQETVKMYEAARHVTREGAREDVQDFFAAVDRIIALEREADSAERVATRSLLTHEVDARRLHLLSRLAGTLEHAADGLAVSALRLRDHLLNDVLTG
jgi:uncharacterized protein Yka (UPF0111/DUF47 family)